MRLTAAQILAPQPAPVRTEESVSVSSAVIAYLLTCDLPEHERARLIGLVEHRRRQGLERYPHELLTHTGRDQALDRAQEIVDAALYHAAELLERDLPLGGIALELWEALEAADRSATARGVLQPPPPTPTPLHTAAELLEAGRRALGYPAAGQDPTLRAWTRIGMMDSTAVRHVADGEGISIYATRVPGRGGADWRVVLSWDDSTRATPEHTVRGTLDTVSEWLRARGWVLQ